MENLQMKVVHYKPGEKEAESLKTVAGCALVGGILFGPIGAVVGGILGAAGADD